MTPDIEALMDKTTSLPDESSPLILYDPILGETPGWPSCWVPVKIVRMRPGMDRKTMKVVWQYLFRFREVWRELAK